MDNLPSAMMQHMYMNMITLMKSNLVKSYNL